MTTILFNIHSKEVEFGQIIVTKQLIRLDGLSTFCTPEEDIAPCSANKSSCSLTDELTDEQLTDLSLSHHLHQRSLSIHH